MRALELGARGRYIRVFIEAGAPVAAVLREISAQDPQQPYLQQLLAAFSTEERAEVVEPSQSTTAKAQQLIEPLSQRELEVLRLIADGRANGAIAAALTIELGTVKRHVHSLLGKLQAPSRTAAVARARELGLL
jgi:LuxR family maltose regulon positive regulatory protein